MEFIFKKVDKVTLIFHMSTILSILLIGVLVLLGFQKGIFSSSEAFAGYIISLGYLAPIVFIILQAIQVVLPILPGAIGCAVGVIVFGPVLGFVYNYIGICVGSIFAFLIARKYGLSCVRKMVHEKSLNKYLGWTKKGTLFRKFFAVAIFAPIAPDDLLCYIAGLTEMTMLEFSTIILLGKPFSILLYSLGLVGVFQFIV